MVMTYVRSKACVSIAIAISSIQIASSFTTEDTGVWTSRRLCRHETRHCTLDLTVERPKMFVRGGQSTSMASQGPITEQETRPASRAYSYYLLWSPGFAAKVVLTSLVLTMLHLSGVSKQIGALPTRLLQSLAGIESIGSNIVLPLLSSSCCVIQLLINMLVGAGGCAGFNTALGPLRPFFLTLLGFMTYLSKPKTSVTLLRGVLALMPEFVHFWNEVFSFWRKLRSTSQTEGAVTATLLVDIPSMGCVACVNKIDSSLMKRAPHNIGSAKTWLDPGAAMGGKTQIVLKVDSKEELNVMKDTILQAIQEAGFGGAAILSVDSPLHAPERK